MILWLSVFKNCRADLRRIIGDEEKIPDFIPRVRNEVLPEVRCMSVCQRTISNEFENDND